LSNIDFLVAWDWEFDAEFVKRLEENARNNGLVTLSVNPSNLSESLEQIIKGKIRFRALLDRASDTNSAFDPLIDKVVFSGAKTINEASHAIRAMDKATMHLEFLTKGIDVPYTIILSPADDVHKIKEKELKHLGRPFIIKPSRGGGGIGVVVGAETLGDIMSARKAFAEDKYLLQEKVVPVIIENKRAYFRVFYVCGKIIPCWWDDNTHIFNVLDKDTENKYKLGKLRDTTSAIAQVSRLDFFSTEICVTEKGRFIVVDYVNDPCDMRPKAIYIDGVPDEVVQQIIDEIITLVKKASFVVLTPAQKEILSRRRDFELALLKRHR
jgi:hypothetical protein